jgi:hypothetical protein
MAYLKRGFLSRESAVLLLTKELMRGRREKGTRGRVT